MRTNLHPQVQMWSPGYNMTGEILRHEIESVFNETLPQILILDLRQVGLTDSDGLAWLVNLNLCMQDSRGGLILLGPSHHVQNLLAEARVTRCFHVLSRPEEIQKFLNKHRDDLGSLQIQPGK